MLFSMPVVLPSFEIATPNMITMMLTTSMISSSVNPRCFLVVLILNKGASPASSARPILLRSLRIARAGAQKIIRLIPNIFSLDLRRADRGRPGVGSTSDDQIVRAHFQNCGRYNFLGAQPPGIVEMHLRRERFH